MQVSESADTGVAMGKVRKTQENPIGLDGMEFVEYASSNPQQLEQLFVKLGFKKIGEHKRKDVALYRQNNVNFVINREQGSFAESFRNAHGPSICATGFRVKDAKAAYQEAVKRGARPCDNPQAHTFPAVYGIGDSLVYFVDKYQKGDVYADDFNLVDDSKNEGVGLFVVDHMTNNVPVGEMQKWCDFYEKIFCFRETRYFDIRGKATGLYSKVMRSPCGKFAIPINEPTDKKSQIQEYLDEYKGSGIQHLALLTHDICKTVAQLKKAGLEFLDTPSTYYDQLLNRLPQVSEDIDTLNDLKILVDGDHDGYLLQIFTKNLIGPIFFEIIQRKGHEGFGEGNFQALFDAIEEDQRRRGYLD